MATPALQAFTRPPTAQEAVLRELRRLIVTGQLQPGQQLRQESLAEHLGVSRVPLREALKILEGEGLVVYEPHRGYFANQLSVGDLLEVYRIRELLETEAATAALPELTEEDLERISDDVETWQRAASDGDLPAMNDIDRRLHFTLFEAADMRRLERLISQAWDATDVYRIVYYAAVKNRSRVAEDHRDLLHALLVRDLTQTIDTLNAHRAHALQHLLSILPE